MCRLECENFRNPYHGAKIAKLAIKQECKSSVFAAKVFFTKFTGKHA